jgi:translocation and assembly module TamB
MATAEISKPKHKHKVLWFRFGLAFAGLVFVALAVAYLDSDAFRERVRRDLVAQLEAITGGNVELKSFTWNLVHLRFDVDGLTIHGLENSSELPYARIDHAHVVVKIVSLLGRQLRLSEFDVQHPVIHLIVFPDGSTNQPSPKMVQAEAGAARLFGLHVDRLRVSQGMLLLNEKQVPLDIDANLVTAGMIYSAKPQPNYAGTLQIGSLRLKHPDASQVLSQAEMAFTVRKNELQVNSLKWTSGNSRLQASGAIIDFHNPRLEANYQGSFELQAVGKVLGQGELRDGIVDLNGTLRYLSPDDFFSSGNASVRNGAYSSAGLRLANVNANSDFTVDVDRITLTKLKGGALGGSFAGNASLLHWAKIAPKARIGTGKRKQLRSRPQEGTIQLALTGIQLSQGARAIFPASDPLNHLHIASIADGKLGIRWTESPRYADVAVDLSAHAPATAPTSELPLSGSIQATYHGRGDRVDVAGVNLAGRATRLSATGVLGVDSRMKVSLNTSDLSELEPVMRAWSAATEPLPAIVHGQASFNGTLTGKLVEPVFAGHLQATNFDTIVGANLSPLGSQESQLSADTNRPARSLHWDSLDADINYSPTSVSARNVTLRQSRAMITGSASAILRDGHFERDLPMEARLAVRDTDLTELQALASTSYPITGKITGQARFTRSREDLIGSGHLQVARGAIYGEAYRSLAADVQFQNKQVDLRNIFLQQDGGNVSGTANYNSGSRGFAFNLTGSNFDLAHVTKIQTKQLPIGGHAEFTASGSGTLAEPTLNARLAVVGFTLGGESVGDFLATAVTHGTDLHLQAQTKTQLASASLTGDVRLREDLPAEIHIDLAKLDFDPLLRAYLPGKLTGHSSLSGKFVLRGPLRRPRDIEVSGDIDQFSSDVQNIKLRNEGPLRFAVSNQVATVQQMHVVGTDTDITGTGKVELAGTRRVDLHANGHVNLAILQSLYPGLSSSGQTTFTLNATGNLGEPSFAGNVQIANGALAFVDLPNGLSEINGSLSFDRNRLRVQKLTAKTGGGDLVLGGYITYANGIFFDLTGTGHDIRIRYPEGISSQATADLRLVGTVQNSLLSGDVTVTKFGLTPQFDLAAYVQRAKQTPAPPNPNSLIDNVRLDVHIVSTPELRVETSMARVSGDVDIRLRGTAARPSVLGRVSIAEGDITFNSTTYHLERGDVVFSNPVRIEPVVNVEASARVRDYDITLGFHGTPDKLNVTYRSEPPLPSEDIIALLAFGRTRQESEVQAEQGSQAASGQSFAQTASNAILGEALNAAVSSRVQKLFGISRIKIDPNLGGTEGNPNARLTVEQQISKNLTVTYLTNLGQYAQEVVQMEYNINKNVSLVAVRDYTGVLAIDFRIRQRKR